ncbi:tyrosine-type recombinase/integrase [Geothrix sp. 21YS21S-2]|uniref:tyrosine-type recombinase/integrase n=1 Tax=Geothrix sp. 21YS21S-2 TaxID=3068893 RepID=UPI0027BA92F2|nr:tyrosine-type recombinase/integrase [Geothrix sp. 21YS21S-2]
MTTKFKNGLAKHPSGHYHYCVRINGRQFKGSTRATDLATARKVLEELRRQVLNEECGTRQIPTLKSVRDNWLQVHKPVHSAKHWYDVEMVSRIWLLPNLENRRVDRITNADVYQVRSKMLEAGRSPVTVNDMLKILKLLINFAIRQGYLKSLPFKVAFLKTQKKPRPVINAAKVSEFLFAIDHEARNPHVPVMLRVMIGLGLRESEVLGMRWEWFDQINQTYIVGKAKGKEARVLPVPSWLWSSIHAMPKIISPWVFPAEDGKPHRQQFCKKALHRVCQKLELGNVTQHRLRATFATLHTEAGTPISEVQGMLGHKNVTTTMIYVETSLGAKRKAQDELGKKLGLA